ncbi:hypothetical protein EV382_1254 [Micromonospora violae]|uniref:Uncharacterized protein n=1 Tax=Micromonospora violae TaxID=1278207 RepID=A0A4Q7UFB2_9ACTN|nr:hypothetical protein [Micromonospora violae]RZT78073.1 hypothetical protein EV382_1254 [Micromonospora violae]
MESRWRDIVVLDYEVDFPTASPLELALYSTGAALAPRILLECADRWGAHRRPGLLDIPAGHYDRTLHEFGNRCAEPSFVAGLAGRLSRCVSRVAEATARLAGADAPTAGGIQAAVDALAELMAFHVLNWALPLTDIETWLAGLTRDPQAARELLMRLLVPNTSAHLTDFATLTAAAHHAIHAGGWSSQRAAELSASIGHLQAPGLPQRPFEDARTLETYVRSLDPPEVGYLEAMRDSRDAARRRLARDTSMLLLAAGGTGRRVARTWAFVSMCRLAAEEEEQRRRWQAKTLQTLRSAADRGGLDLGTVLPSACDTDETAGDRPVLLIDATDGAWAWLRS